jgi:hypothetical protein
MAIYYGRNSAAGLKAARSAFPASWTQVTGSGETATPDWVLLKSLLDWSLRPEWQLLRALCATSFTLLFFYRKWDTW